MSEEKEFSYADYVEVFKQTAMYPGVGTGNWEELSYLTLGLIGEIAEYQVNPTLHELGDCCWYIVGLREFLLAKGYGEPGWYDKKDPSKLYRHPMLPMASLANACKKVLRDGETEEKLKTILLSVLWLQQDVAEWAEDLHECTINEVSRVNAEKLLSRKERGVLQGDGDNR